MHPFGDCTALRHRRSAHAFALVTVFLLTSCAPADPTGTFEGLEAPRVSGRHPWGPAPAFFVSPAGSPSGDGSFDNPWDLATALDAPAGVTPGSTIWLRGGTYANGPHFGHGYLSNLVGTAEAPIVVRQYPGERATVTKFLVIRGGYTWYWGFEVVHPAPQAGVAFGIDLGGPGTKLINLVVHDASASGIYVRPEAGDAEVYGAIVYNNGRTDRFDHGVYCRSQTSLLLQDNIVFDNWAYGIHCFAREEGAYLQNITLEGNVAFNNYVWGVPGADLLVGGHVPASGIIINNNYTYRTSFTNTMAAEIGHGAWTNQDLVFTNNYSVGGWWYVGDWVTAKVSGNTLYNFTTGGMVWSIGNVRGHTWSDNTFFGDSTAQAWRHNDSSVTAFSDWRARTGFADPGRYAGSTPTGLKVAVHPNRYQPGRANIIVYNWALKGSVSVDPSGILDLGDRYAVRHAQDFYGTPIASGVYTGGPLELPMVSIDPPAPLGVVLTGPAPTTGPIFNVFVLTRAARPAAPYPGGAGPQGARWRRK
jgi:hypothetical protein